MPDPYSPSLCKRIISAFHYQRPLITQKSEEKLAASKKFVTLKIPDKGVVSLHDISDDVRFRAARQPFQHYRTIPAGPPDLVEGTMPGRGCDGKAQMMEALVDTTDINACQGVQQWNFAHGFATRTAFDLKFAYKSPVICIEQYARQGPDRVRAFFNLLIDEFTKYGPDNFEAELAYQVIRHAESNISMVGSSTHFNPTTNGWEAPPEWLLSIPRLERIRQYMMGVEDSDIGTETDMLEISVRRDDWFHAVHQDILRTSGPQVSLNTMYYTDPRSQYYGKGFHEYKNIRAIFDDNPRKGYFKPNGAGSFDWVEIYQWRNVRGETIHGADDGGGLVAERNPDYWKDFIVCDGATYRVVALAWMLPGKAFERYRISESVAPAGVNPVGNNFNIQVRDGTWVPCNDLENQFYLISQHKARLKVKLPKLAGAIVYIPKHTDIGYDLAPCSDTTPDTTTDAPASYNPLEDPRPDLCEQSNCETCLDLVANDQGACVADADGLFTMSPCGTASVVVVDEAGHDLVIRVYRTGNLKDVATVDFAVAAVTAIAATHFTDPADDTLEWAADEGGYKEIVVPILAADAVDPKTFTVTLSNPTGGADVGDCTVLTVTIEPTG